MLLSFLRGNRRDQELNIVDGAFPLVHKSAAGIIIMNVDTDAKEGGLQIQEQPLIVRSDERTTDSTGRHCRPDSGPNPDNDDEDEPLLMPIWITWLCRCLKPQHQRWLVSRQNGRVYAILAVLVVLFDVFYFSGPFDSVTGGIILLVTVFGLISYLISSFWNEVNENIVHQDSKNIMTITETMNGMNATMNEIQTGMNQLLRHYELPEIDDRTAKAQQQDTANAAQNSVENNGTMFVC